MRKEGTREIYKKNILDICRKEHFSANNILEILQGDFPKAGVATVYRTIKSLSEKGLLNKISGPQKKFFYETNENFHGHIIYKNKINDFDLPKTFIKSLEKKLGKKIKNFDLRIEF